MSAPHTDPAAARFFTLQLVRASGVALVVVGLLMSQGSLFPGLPRWAAYIPLGIGFLDVFVLTRVLARRWRSRD